MPDIVTQSQSESSKSKTKAKSRYLRRKKERRKARKSAAPRKTGDKPLEKHISNDEDESAGEDTDSESEDNETEAKVIVIPKTDGQQKAKKEMRKENSDERPEKRRKVVDEEDIQMAEADSSPKPDSQEHAHIPTSMDKPVRKSISPRPALSAFPLPAAPEAPPKSVLALQGLDQAMLGATTVNPGISISIVDEQEDITFALSERTRKRLLELGITELFAVQTALLPFLLPKAPLQRCLYMPFDPPRDVCVSAPTGSGKTLAYVIPILEILSSRTVTHLRALVVLPTRDLVTQVRETFEAIGKGHGLKIGVATGQHSFAHEQAQLIADKSSQLRGGSSKVDILICTPGRLIDHLTGTPNFSLQHLRFLVIDEADRLLAQSFQDWLAQVLAATRPALHHQPQALSRGHVSTEIPFADALAPNFLGCLQANSFVADNDETKHSSCQKLLFSATLTRDPGKLAALDLRSPQYFVVQSDTAAGIDEPVGVVTDRFTMPATLNEHMIVCESSQKPLLLFHLIQNHNVRNALVFTKSSESTARLVKLFQCFEAARASEERATVIRAYSSDLAAGERKIILDKFKAQEVDILVCSDLISRGIDISHVSHVVSYDVPVDMRKYVHRVGRTARAGRTGEAWTLVEEQEARYFKSMLKASDHLNRVKRLRVSENDLSSLAGPYQIALQNLKEMYTR
ncbi:DEAD-domain-containing protein [Hygrophoropsis aurantiaca]|uniref:DEAD-domain-containing protein n=1 Tax=Hygrophoropsis aurantiaca TaxID=72124 RepID=A0ACB8A8V7_9AGAM|nr:DEAD-domain-containing protein [Hygrophoropsis aurantiaca]